VFGATTEGTGGTRLNGFELSASAVALVGDFDGSGAVNAVDLTIWRNHYPTASGATSATGDADGDQDVDGTDFMLWQRNVGATGTSPVPEPGVTAQLLIAIGSLIIRSTRPRQ
jgi:hypothetical protein